MFRCDTDSVDTIYIMNMSNPILHSFIFIILLVTLYLMLDNRQDSALEEFDLTANEISTDPIYSLQEKINSLLPILIVSILIGIVFAVLLQEWVPGESWIYRLSDFIIAVLAGIPSVFYGLLCVYYFLLKSGRVSYLTQSLTVVLLTMPITFQSTQNAVKSVDVSIREAVYALGVKKSKVITAHVIPHAYSGIMSGVYTAVSRSFFVAGLILVTFTWIQTIHSRISFSIPKNASVFLIAALLCSLCSSLLKKRSVNTDYVA